jgi:hypothetical protein
LKKNVKDINDSLKEIEELNIIVDTNDLIQDVTDSHLIIDLAQILLFGHKN